MTIKANLVADLAGIEEEIAELNAKLNQLIGARQFCQAYITLIEKEGEGDEPSPKSDDAQSEQG